MTAAIQFYDDKILFTDDDPPKIVMDPDCCCNVGLPCEFAAHPPAYLQVDISGITGGTNNCQCTCLNRTYYLPSTAACVWTKTYHCQIIAGALTVTCTVTLETGHYYLELTIGSATFQADLGTSLPDLSELSALPLAYVSGDGGSACCVAAGATVTITAASEDLETGLLPAGTAYCPSCGEGPTSYTITMSGWPNKVYITDSIYEDMTPLNGTFVAVPSSSNPDYCGTFVSDGYAWTHRDYPPDSIKVLLKSTVYMGTYTRDKVVFRLEYPAIPARYLDFGTVQGANTSLTICGTSMSWTFTGILDGHTITVTILAN